MYGVFQPTYNRYSAVVTCENRQGTSTAPVERVYGYSGEDSKHKFLANVITIILFL